MIQEGFCLNNDIVLQRTRSYRASSISSPFFPAPSPGPRPIRNEKRAPPASSVSPRYDTRGAPRPLSGYLLRHRRRVNSSNSFSSVRDEKYRAALRRRDSNKCSHPSVYTGIAGADRGAPRESPSISRALPGKVNFLKIKNI